MRKLTGRERILTALRLQEPDTVPHMELMINPAVREKILPGRPYEDLIEYLDIDGIAYFDIWMDKYEVLDESRGIIRDKWGVIKRKSAETTPVPLEPAIKSEKDLAAYIPPDPDEPGKYKPLENMVKRFKGERAILALVEQPFSVVGDILGTANHFMDMVRNPDLVLRLNEIVVTHHLKVAKNCIEIGADVMMVAGDFAITSGPMVSPRHLEKFAMPPLAAIVAFIRSQGLPCMLHCDGNLMSIMEMVLGTGIDGLHPIDPMAGMDIGVVKEGYGDRICLMGSINCGHLLMQGTTEQVHQAVKENLRKAGRGGSLIAASSHTIHSGVKPENYVEMVKAIRKYGRYPLRLD